MDPTQLPTLIQGGMGAGVSSWRLARVVARAGQLGVVAGTALDVILVRRLQLGDPDGSMRGALACFPLPEVARRIVARYYVPGGKAESDPFVALPLLDADDSRDREELIVAANFVEVHLSKQGHAGLVGINYLEKIQLPTLPSLYGAMLAGVDFVLMGAGIPRAIPAVLDDLAAGRQVQLTIDVREAREVGEHRLTFDPREFFGGPPPGLERPRFLAIVSSVTVASVLARKASGRIDGLIVEGHVAGGHNAPPRGRGRTSDTNGTVFGERDVPDLTAIARLGLPFWVAGACASPQRLREVQGQGAVGVQVGTAFAFCAESGLDSKLRSEALALIRSGEAEVITDLRASPTGFPFKVLQLQGTASEAGVFERRRQVCDLGYLRHAYERSDGSVGWRCPGEPERVYLGKGGDAGEATGRKCVCNGLLANVGLGQVRSDGTLEPALLTSGTDLEVVSTLLADEREGYSALQVMEYVLGG